MSVAWPHIVVAAKVVAAQQLSPGCGRFLARSRTRMSKVHESHCAGGLTPHRSPVFCVQRDDVETVARRLNSMATAAMASGASAARRERLISASVRP